MTPARHIRRLLLIPVAVLALGVCHDVGCTAHAGQPARRLRKEVRITVLHPVRVQARAAAGFPMRQVLVNVTATGAYVAGTAFNVSRLIPNPNGILANIILPRW